MIFTPNTTSGNNNLSYPYPEAENSFQFIKIIDKMKERGYEITGETFGEGSAKYIAFRPLGKERFIRGRAQSLGEDYTKERIRERIDERIYRRAEQIVSESLSKKAQNSMYSDPYSTGMATKLIDTSSEKFAQSISLTKWADKQNFKLIATMYADLDKFGVHSIAELGDKEHDLRIETHKAKKEVVNIEKEIKEYSEVLRYAEYYFKYKKYNSEYNALKPKARDKYYNTYYTQLGLYEAAVNVLKNHNIDLKTLSLKSINEHYNQLLEKRIPYILHTDLWKLNTLLVKIPTTALPHILVFPTKARELSGKEMTSAFKRHLICHNIV